MSPQRSGSSRSRLKLSTLLPCPSLKLPVKLFLIVQLVQLIESTPNSKFLPKYQQTADQLDPLNEHSLQRELLSRSSADGVGIQNATGSLFELINQRALTTGSFNDPLLQQAALAAGQQPGGLLDASAQAIDARPGASLAQSTAAGTVAGLRIAQDLIAQANMVEGSPYGREEGDGQSMNQDGDEASDGDNLDDSDQSQAFGGDQPARFEDANSADELQLQQAARRQMIASNSQAQQAAQDEAQAAEPMNENQVPDSIESLMGADIEDADEGQANEQSQADEIAGQQQQPAGSVPPQLTSRQSIPSTQAMFEGAEDSGESDDNEDDNESPIERQDVATFAQGAKSPAMFEAPPVELAQGALMPRGRPMFEAGAPELNHNLVAPMRDSLEDLNAAAGHYYGKKKKEKKVKKIIIKKKKKKKKKKKMIKIKKIKVIKIKKKKKGKKHYPKKHYHKHHHGHDHGKYYMYAKVPKKKAWEFGFKKGNKKHWISRHEKGYKSKFKTKVKWEDKKSKGKGFHVWDYNHHDKKKKGHY